MNILEKANQIINERSEEKERQYGPFQASMERAAALYNLMSPKDQQITTAGMYRAMIALKLSREAYAHKEDNLLDAVAYMGSMNDYLEEHKDIHDTEIPGSILKECCEKFPNDCCHDCEYFNASSIKCTYKSNK